MKNKDSARIIVLREDLVAITENHVLAIILNYFIERFEETQEEWMSKKADELVEELLLDISMMTMQRRLNDIVNKDYLKKRNNLENKFDKVFQYKVNMDKINKDLKSKDF